MCWNWILVFKTTWFIGPIDRIRDIRLVKGWQKKFFSLLFIKLLNIESNLLTGWVIEFWVWIMSPILFAIGSSWKRGVRKLVLEIVVKLWVLQILRLLLGLTQEFYTHVQDWWLVILKRWTEYESWKYCEIGEANIFWHCRSVSCMLASILFSNSDILQLVVLEKEYRKQN